MASLSIPNSFTNNTVASATEVNANFTSVKTYAESALVQVDGSVQAPTVAIANLAVTTAKIADDAVTAAKIATNAVGTSEIANDAVTADKVLDNATFPVNISGNAATASTASAVTWANVSGKPAIGDVFNNGGTYGINVSGNAATASSAGYASSAGDASTADSLNNAGNSIYFGGGSWNSQQVHYFNAGLNVQSGSSIFNGNVYLSSLPSPTSSTSVLVEAAGLVKKRELSPWSLREMKEQIEPLNEALSKVKSLQPRTFRFKEDVLIADEPFDAFNRREQLQYGFIVDEVGSSETPDLVAYGSPDGVSKYIQSWKIDGVVSLAVGAIKELSDKVDSLEARLAALEAK